MKKILLFILLTSLSFHIKSQIISQYVESNNGSHPKLIEIYNNTGSTLDFNITFLSSIRKNRVLPKGLFKLPTQN